MNETQQTIGSWARETFQGGEDLSPRHVLRLLEEVVEASQAAGATWLEVVKTVRNLRPPFPEWSLSKPLSPEKVSEELADCSIVLAVIAERRCIDLAEEVNRKMAVNRSRIWVANGDGTGYHQKEEFRDGSVPGGIDSSVGLSESPEAS